MITSLKTRIAVWYISLSTLVLVCLGVALYLIISHSMMNERRAVIAQDLERLPHVAQRFGNRGVDRMLDEAQEEIPLKPADEFVQIFTPAGASVASSANLRGRSLPFRPDLASATLPFETISTSGDRAPALIGVTQININNAPYFAPSLFRSRTSEVFNVDFCSHYWYRFPWQFFCHSWAARFSRVTRLSRSTG